MDQRERTADSQEGLRVAIEGFLSKLWTAFPAIVQSFNPAQMTVTVQPAFQVQVPDSKGNPNWQPLLVITDVPVVFYAAGGFALTLPVKKGDEVLVVCACRCCDGWWQNGAATGPQLQPELRMHAMADSFAIFGVKSLPNVLPTISTTTMQLRSQDGLTYLEIAPGGVINIKAPGGLNVTGNINETGAIVASGDVTAGTVTLQTHLHTDPQGGTSGPATG
jgi:hypothetical protein